MYVKHIKYRCACGRVSWAVNIVPKCPICKITICDSCRVDSFCARCGGKLSFTERKEYWNAQENMAFGTGASFVCTGIGITIAGLMIMFAFFTWSTVLFIASLVLIGVSITIGVLGRKKVKKSSAEQARWNEKVLPRVQKESGSRSPPRTAPQIDASKTTAPSLDKLRRCPKCGGKLLVSSKIDKKTGRRMKQCVRCSMFF